MVEMLGHDAPLLTCQADGMGAECSVGLRQRRAGPIADHRVDEGIGLLVGGERPLDLFPEVVRRAPSFSTDTRVRPRPPWRASLAGSSTAETRPS